MEFANQLILLLGVLFLLSILAGVLSSRVGAPLLLVFLALGMLLGEDGPGGIKFGDFGTSFVVGSVALAIILFDGGFRTPMTSVRVAWKPAAVLATLGVVISAVITGGFAWLVFEGGWFHGLLIATTVASTDAAAVFLLLRQRGLNLKRRLTATLEIESGANDPTAILLTITLVQVMMAAGSGGGALDIAELFARQLILGVAFGLAGGWAMPAVVNRLELAAGLYPVFVVAGALFVFGGTQLLGGSGFLAVYLAGIVAGNRRLRAGKLIRRFHDGIAWVSQIVMFVMLGLLVTPTNLIPDFMPSLIVALALIFIARPIAVYLCLIPFNYSRAEKLFIAWVGLRGAVPIFLAMIPVLGGVSNSMHYFNVAFLVVLLSLVLQGWTIPWLARRLNLELPSRPEPRGKLDLDLLNDGERDVVAYRVTGKSPLAGRPPETLVLPESARLLAILRDDQVHAGDDIDRFEMGDIGLIVSPPESSFVIDRQFLPRPATVSLGDFTFAGTTMMKALADLYGLPVDPNDWTKTAADYLREKLGPGLDEGDVVVLGEVELVVGDRIGDEIIEVSLRLEPEPTPLFVVRAGEVLAWLGALFQRR